MSKRKPFGLTLKLNPSANPNSNESAISNMRNKFENLSLFKSLFNSIDDMPETTDAEIFNKYNKAFEILQEQYEITHKDIITNPEYRDAYKSFNEKLQEVKNELLKNVKSADVLKETERNESLKNTFSNVGNVDQGRRLKLEEKYVSQKNAYSKLHSDEVLVMFDVQVFKRCIGGKCSIKKIITPRDTYNKNQKYYTLYKAVYEIAMQSLAREIVEKDENLEKIIVPEITDYYLVFVKDENDIHMKIVIEMEYVDNSKLENKEQLLRAHDALLRLREKYKIFHNDSHKENIRYQPKTDKIVLFDWDVASVGKSKIHESSSQGITMDKVAIDEAYFKDWIELKQPPYMINATLGGKKTKKSKKSKNQKKTKKNKKSKKTKKMKKIKKSKKTKKMKK